MILITGMQRSGTSMVSQLLAALGTSFGDPTDLLPNDRWNPGGYFEAKPVMDVNSRIITGLSRTRSRPGAWLSKVAYLGMPRASTIAARAAAQRATVEQLGERYRTCAVKDPRFCMTLRYWLQWTDVDRVVVCMRHPAPVVASLARRHHLPRWLGARFYAWHVNALVEQLVEAMPTHAVHFVDVDALVAGSTAELDALRRALDLVSGPASADLLRDVVKARLYAAAGHHAHATSQAADAAWHRLSALAASHRRTTADARTN